MGAGERGEFSRHSFSWSQTLRLKELVLSLGTTGQKGKGQEASTCLTLLFARISLKSMLPAQPEASGPGCRGWNKRLWAFCLWRAGNLMLLGQEEGGGRGRA